MYRINKPTRKIDVLLKQPRQLFHTGDLALLWQIENRNTLYTAIKRYLKQGILFQVHKGYYSTVPMWQINPVELGMGALHRYAYHTAESALAHYGVIPQLSPVITLASNVSRRLQLGEHEYVVRKMAEKYLFSPIGILEVNQIKTASLERAVADLLYFNPRYHLDGKSLIDWDKVVAVQQEIGYQ